MAHERIHAIGVLGRRRRSAGEGARNACGYQPVVATISGDASRPKAKALVRRRQGA
jgi:hypothetical protein